MDKGDVELIERVIFLNLKLLSETVVMFIHKKLLQENITLWDKIVTSLALSPVTTQVIAYETKSIILTGLFHNITWIHLQDTINLYYYMQWST